MKTNKCVKITWQSNGTKAGMERGACFIVRGPGLAEKSREPRTYLGKDTR